MMRSSAFLAVTAVLVCFTVANAQTNTPITPPSGGNYYGGGYGVYGGGHASTAAEGRLRGMGDVMRSAGQANLNNSAAAINYSIAQRNQIENREAWTHSYFQMRQANRAYRAAERGPAATMEQMVRFAQVGKPKPLSAGEVDPVSGSINWPMLLQGDDFADQRAEVEKAFAKRAGSSMMSEDDFMKTREATEEMAANLKKKIRDVPSYKYMQSKKFIDSLAYAAGQPAS